jgi:hypothetical protein
VKRPVLAIGVTVAILGIVGSALGARGFSDQADDANTAPDVTAVEVSEAVSGTLSIRLTVGNFQTLPEDSWVNLWFDTDSNQNTGAEGDEALVRHVDSGAPEVYLWTGSQLVEAASSGVQSSFADGVLTVSVTRAAIGATAPFGLLAVTSRGQPVGDEQLIASDFAPDAGRLAFTGPTATSVADPAGDHDAAPDITAVRVSDAKNGWITFAVTTPNYEVLPEASAVVISIDADADARTGEAGADVQVALAAGQISMERWDGRRWLPDELPTRARFRNAANVVSIDVHASELRNTARFRFSLLAADVNTAIQGVVALDIAPDAFAYWSYALANKPALSLATRRVAATPARPRSGQRVTLALPVTRSDTGRAISSGTVACNVRLAGRPLAARGAIGGGAGRCTFTLPAGATGKTVRGTITVRSSGARAARSFSFVVR